MRRWTVTRITIFILQFLWTIVKGESLFGSRGEIWKETKYSSDGEDEKIFDITSIYSWSGPNALARSSLLERQENLQNNCEELPDIEVRRKITSLNEFSNILVDEKHKLLYCYVPKVACTNWKRVLMVISGKWGGSDPMEIPADQAHAMGIFPRLSNYTLEEIENKIINYDKLIVVRHPLERLLSAFRNKLEAKHEKSSKYFQERFGRKIIKKYRANATKESITKGDDVTFREFVDFITDIKRNGSHNEHWKPFSNLCHPCIVNYNLVSKYESLVEDATEILERIGAESITFPARSSKNQPTSEKLNEYYSTLSFKQLRKLANFYKTDLKLFDYSLEDIVGFSIA